MKPMIAVCIFSCQDYFMHFYIHSLIQMHAHQKSIRIFLNYVIAFPCCTSELHAISISRKAQLFHSLADLLTHSLIQHTSMRANHLPDLGPVLAKQTQIWLVTPPEELSVSQGRCPPPPVLEDVVSALADVWGGVIRKGRSTECILGGLRKSYDKDMKAKP